VREIVGVDPALNQRWSTRRVLIKDRQGELASRFQRDHGRPPTPVEALQLAQQATLETRDAKHEPRSLAEQRTAWHAQAAETLGGPRAVQAMISKTLNPISITSPEVDTEWVAATAGRVLAAVEERRSSWQSWHVRAEAQRHVRAADIATDKVEQLVELLVTEVLQTRSVPLTRTDDGISEPGVLCRVDGSSVYTVAGSELFTSARILAAEQRLVATAGRADGRVVDAGTVELALLESAANGNALDAGQAALVRAMCTSGARLQLAIAPAGAGKTTAMRTLAHAWGDSGGHVIGLAPSAAAAAQLRDATGAPVETLAKLTWSIHHTDLPDWAERIGRCSLVIIDEAGMADTSPWTPPFSSSSAAAAASGLSVMINSWPRSVPAGCSATSKPVMARYCPPPRPSCSNKSLPETAVQDRPAPCCESTKTPPSGSANPSGATSTPCT
jgi:limonene-1,2-epoxide hydrolase